MSQYNDTPTNGVNGYYSFTLVEPGIHPQLVQFVVTASSNVLKIDGGALDQRR